MTHVYVVILLLLAVGLMSCTSTNGPGPSSPRPAQPAAAPAVVPGGPVASLTTPATRRGDEIVVAGRFIHTGTPVVLWLDPGGYSGYAGENLSHPVSFGIRTDAQNRPVPRDLADLAKVIDQLVLHYDDCGTSKRCFAALQARHLSVHFMLDLDGTIYQTLDVAEKAYDATIANNRSIGVEMANIGAYAADDPDVKRLSQWYPRDRNGHWFVVVPPGELRYPGVTPRPMRDELIVGRVQGKMLEQFDYTPQQYAALAHLTAALCKEFPLLRCDYPHDATGRLIDHKLPDDQLAAYHGILGHYHIQTNKTDPGPAFQWDLLVQQARADMSQAENPTP
jgi:N-acetylmuramoyl-L-alanine amidase